MLSRLKRQHTTRDATCGALESFCRLTKYIGWHCSISCLAAAGKIFDSLIDRLFFYPFFIDTLCYLVTRPFTANVVLTAVGKKEKTASHVRCVCTSSKLSVPFVFEVLFERENFNLFFLFVLLLVFN